MPIDKSKRGGLKPSTMKVFTETEVNVLLEDVNHNLQMLAEGQQSIQEKLGRIEGNQGAHARRLERAEIRLDVIEGHQH